MVPEKREKLVNDNKTNASLGYKPGTATDSWEASMVPQPLDGRSSAFEDSMDLIQLTNERWPSMQSKISSQNTLQVIVLSVSIGSGNERGGFEVS